MFESLSDKLKRTLKNLRGEGVLTKEHVDAALREIRLALLEADVNYKVAKDFIASVKEKAEGQQVWQELKPSEQVVKIVFDELVDMLGGQSSAGFTRQIPNVVMIVACRFRQDNLDWENRPLAGGEQIASHCCSRLTFTAGGSESSSRLSPGQLVNRSLNRPRRTIR